MKEMLIYDDTVSSTWSWVAAAAGVRDSFPVEKSLFASELFHHEMRAIFHCTKTFLPPLKSHEKVFYISIRIFSDHDNMLMSVIWVGFVM